MLAAVRQPHFQHPSFLVVFVAARVIKNSIWAALDPMNIIEYIRIGTGGFRFFQMIYERYI